MNILNRNYLRSNRIYDDFVSNNVNKPEHFSNKEIPYSNLPFFPIYMSISDETIKKSEYLKAYTIIRDFYLEVDRDYLLDGDFWKTLLLITYRDEIMKKYPEVLKRESTFNNIVYKKFDWENYIYKVVLATQYLNDYVEEGVRNHYFNVILDNLDLYNYIIKYRIFRNGLFLYNVLKIVENNDLSKILKAQIKNRPDLSSDERYGRRVIFEFNKNYPVIMSPMLSLDELEEQFIRYLNDYIQA
jgi:hypothetical protein